MLVLVFSLLSFLSTSWLALSGRSLDSFLSCYTYFCSCLHNTRLISSLCRAYRFMSCPLKFINARSDKLICTIVEEIKVCQMAGRSISKHGNEGKGKPRDVLNGRLACCLCVCLLLSLVDAKRQFLCPQGANDQLARPHYVRHVENKHSFYEALAIKKRNFISRVNGRHGRCKKRFAAGLGRLH